MGIPLEDFIIKQLNKKFPRILGGKRQMMDFIKLSRKLLEWEWYTDVNTCKLFIHMLLKANWKDGRFQGVDVPRGAFVTSISKLASQTGLSEMQVRTAVKHLKATGEITGRQHGKFTVFTVNNYNLYQSDNRQIIPKRQIDNTEVTESQQVDNTEVTTIEEKKEVKKGRKEEGKKDNHISSGTSADRTPEYPYKAVIDYLNIKMGTSYRSSSKDTQSYIRAICNEGYTLTDFEKVIDKKVREWKGTEFEKFLRPATLFGPMFESYLNQTGRLNSTVGNKFNNFQARDYDCAAMERAFLEADS